MRSMDKMVHIITMKSVMAFALLAFFLSVLICQGEADTMKSLEILLGFDQIPVNHTCDGMDISPRIEVNGLNATSVAIILDDPDAPLGTFTHWIIWNMQTTEVIPAGIPKDPVVTKPIKAVQGSNSAGEIGYMGPCPPRGKTHRYHFKVYGLDEMLNLSAGATKMDLENSMRGHILQQGEAMATYMR
jgi:Raf kinase inhibitor-like YbhB/YbcL family protein